MADLTREPYSCEKIINEDIRFSIPIYQRLFVWGEQQIEKLLDDVRDAVKKGMGQYYVGVVTIKRPSEGNGGELWELVDGQQRNTFLTLFAAECLSRQSQIWKDFVFCDESKRTLRIAYMGREEDEEDIRLLAVGSVNSIRNKNFLVFHRVFTKWVGLLEKKEQEQLESFVFSKVAFFVSELPRSYKASELNLYFERMNAAGQQLGLLDVVKGRFFPKYSARLDAAISFGKRRFNPVEQQEGTELTLCKILEDESPPPAEDQPNLVSVRSVISPELMMLHTLSFVKGLSSDNVLTDERKIVSIFDEYRTECGEGWDSEASAFLDELEKYRKWIDNNLVYIDLESDERVYRFRSIDPDPDPDPLDENISNKTAESLLVVDRLRQFESMLYVCYPNGEEWAYAAYKHFQDPEQDAGNVPKADLLAYLMQWDQKDALPKYVELNYAQIERRWFWRLDYILWDLISNVPPSKSLPPWMPPNLISDNVRKSAIRKYTFKPNRSIEHLHPQTATDNSKEVRSSWGGKLVNTSNVRIEDSFGNLAMISSSFNSQQGNDQINTKLARIKDQVNENRIESIKMVVMSALAGDDIGRWTVEMAKDHGEKMYELLKDVYDVDCESYSQSTPKTEDSCVFSIDSFREYLSSMSVDCAEFGGDVEFNMNSRNDACVEGKWIGRYFLLSVGGGQQFEGWFGCRYGGEFYMPDGGWVSCADRPVFVVQVKKEDCKILLQRGLMSGWYAGKGKCGCEYESLWQNHIIEVQGSDWNAFSCGLMMALRQLQSV